MAKPANTKGEKSSSDEVPLLLTKSRFFIDAFNTAIIDGPLRIYFSDKQETEALHIYFEIQESLAQQGLKLTHLAGQSKHAFVMLYPDPTSFEQVFQTSKDEWVMDQFGENVIFGLKKFKEKDRRLEISKQVSDLIQSAAAL